MAYATINDVQARMMRTLDSDEQAVCATLLDDAAVLIDSIDPDEVIIPSLTEGTGTVRCQHGILSVPVPAVVNIVKDNGLNLKISGVQGELVTPTGAAIAAAIRTSSKLPSDFTIDKIGIGAGKRE